MPDEQQPVVPEKLTIKTQRELKQEMKQQKRQAAARQDKVKNIITWTIIGGVVVAIIALAIASRGGSGSGTVAPVTDQDHVRGERSAKAVIIEYSDFQCPACGAYHPVLKNLEAKFGKDVAVVYRNFPLTTLHQYAQLAAQAAEAANLQGKYWEMHDLLFERQDAWPKSGNVQQTFVEYANELKLDTAKFTQDITSSTVKDRVALDVTSGNAVAINSTPTFYLNGKKLNNPGSEAAFSTLIEAELGITNSNQ
jgi:protein-disulfide isomerase